MIIEFKVYHNRISRLLSSFCQWSHQVTHVLPLNINKSGGLFWRGPIKWDQLKKRGAVRLAHERYSTRAPEFLEHPQLLPFTPSTSFNNVNELTVFHHDRVLKSIVNTLSVVTTSSELTASHFHFTSRGVLEKEQYGALTLTP
jgi:hypothetical protein